MIFCNGEILLSFLSLLYFTDNQNAGFVEQPHGEGYDAEGEAIGSGSDDGSNDEQSHNDVATIVAHHLCIDEPHASENPTDDGDFKQYAHGETDAHQCVHIGFNGNGVGHGFAHLIGTKETEYQRENKKIAEQYAEHEHGVS